MDSIRVFCCELFIFILYYLPVLSMKAPARCFYAFFLLSTLLAVPAVAQKVWYLKPYLGGQFPLDSYDRSKGKAANLSSGKLNIDLSFGIDMQVELNRQWRLSLGSHYGTYGFNYNIVNLVGRASSSNIIRFPFQVHYTLKDDVQLINLDKIKYNYLLVFKLYGLLGVSYNRVGRPGNFGQYTNVGNSNVKVYEYTPVVTNRNNASLYVGVGFQFHNGEKDRFDVSFYYSQGIGKIAYKDIAYEIEGTSYQTRLWSRGTILGFNVSYPIRLKTFKPKLKLP